jgi:hypothetical protein
MMFEEMTTQEIALVSGGDHWAGTPEGREPTAWTYSLSPLGPLSPTSQAGGSLGPAGHAGAYVPVKARFQSF